MQRIGEKSLSWISVGDGILPKGAEGKQLRAFGLLVGGVFAAIALFPYIWRAENIRLWALAIGIILLVSALAFPGRLQLPYRVWMALGQALGWLNTRIILSVVFYGLFTPIGWARRYFGEDPLSRSFETGVETYRRVRQPRPSSHMMRQF